MCNKAHTLSSEHPTPYSISAVITPERYVLCGFAGGSAEQSGFVQQNTIYCTNVDNILGEHYMHCCVGKRCVYNLNNPFGSLMLESRQRHLLIFPPNSIQLPLVHKSNIISAIVIRFAYGFSNTQIVFVMMCFGNEYY